MPDLEELKKGVDAIGKTFHEFFPNLWRIIDFIIYLLRRFSIFIPIRMQYFWCSKVTIDIPPIHQSRLNLLYILPNSPIPSSYKTLNKLFTRELKNPRDINCSLDNFRSPSRNCDHR